MNGTSQRDNLEYIKSAVRLRLLLESWLTDQDFASRGDGIIYAVDTNVVKMFSAGLTKFSGIFQGDDENTREITAFAIGLFIFFRLTKERPLLLIPPHHLELDNIFAGLARDALKELGEIRDSWPKIEKYFEEYAKTKDINVFISSIKKEPLALIRFMLGSGYTAELSRITELLKNDRLLHIERYVERHDGKVWTLPVPHDSTDSTDYKTLKNLSKDWLEKLGEEKSKNIPDSLISNDADVLARVEWINNELRGTGRRLVLISADAALQQAASKYYVNKRKFADLFIRDPRIFVAAPNFLTAEKTNGETTRKSYNLIGWLDVFLAGYLPGQPGYRVRLEEVLLLSGDKANELVDQFLKEIPHAISELRQHWKEFVQLTAVEYSLSTEGERLKKFVEMVAENNLKQAREKINSMVFQVWRDFWKLATLAGLWSTDAFEKISRDIGQVRDKLPLRGIPPLRFTLEPVHSYVKTLCQTLRYEEVIEQKILFDDITFEDPSNYTAFLLYALAFGAAGRYSVTRNLAEFALEIADKEAYKYKMPKDLEPITGNEAAYLLAWAIRHTMSNSTQLGDAQQYLQGARLRRAKATGGDGADIRYDSESLAIDVTYHFFRVFSGETIPVDIPTLIQCQERSLELLKSIDLDKSEEEYIRITIKRQLITYLFCTIFLRQFKDGETITEQEMQEVLKWLPEFETILVSAQHRILNSFTHPVYLVASYLYGSAERKKEYALAAKDILGGRERQYSYVMPYDEELYGFFGDLINRG